MRLSIAIPAYNAAKSLERTVASILAQTFTDFELLIVNNGSADETGEVARRLAEKDGRIKVFDVYPNVGGYGARLYAWRRASGEFITSVDADDWIEPDMYERMLGAAVANDLDVVQCDIIGEETSRPPDGAELEMSEGEALKDFIYRSFIDVGEGAFIWNKIYRNQYDFSKWRTGDFGSYEDLIHNLQLFVPIKKYGYLHCGFYHYEVTPASVTKNFNVARVGQFANVVAAKRELAGAYGIAPDAAVLDKWVANDARNALIMAATAGAPSWAVRVANVKAVLACPEVRVAVGKCRNYGLMNWAMRLPAWVTALGLNLAAKIR